MNRDDQDDEISRKVWEIEKMRREIERPVSPDEPEYTFSRKAEPETGWLIEENGNPPRWWAGTRYGWITDASKAVRFCREADAQRVIESIDWANPVDIIVTEHRWG